MINSGSGSLREHLDGRATSPGYEKPPCAELRARFTRVATVERHREIPVRHFHVAADDRLSARVPAIHEAYVLPLVGGDGERDHGPGANDRDDLQRSVEVRSPRRGLERLGRNRVEWLKGVERQWAACDALFTPVQWKPSRLDSSAGANGLPSDRNRAKIRRDVVVVDAARHHRAPQQSGCERRREKAGPLHTRGTASVLPKVRPTLARSLRVERAHPARGASRGTRGHLTSRQRRRLYAGRQPGRACRRESAAGRRVPPQARRTRRRTRSCSA